MRAHITRFLAAVLTACALVPGGAHLLAMPNKLAMNQADYFVAQQVYRGWALLGVVIFLALFANAAAAVFASGRVRGFSVAAALLIAATLAVFAIWTYPANAATANWMTVPADWMELRTRWEISHAVNALLTFAALCCAVSAAAFSAAET
jgi:hypothetical protein